MKTRVEFVGEEDGSRLEGVDNRPDQTEPDSSPQRLVFGIELDVAVDSSVGESYAELLERGAIVAVGAFRESMEVVADHLDPALRAGHSDFTATRTEIEPVKDTGAVRFDIKPAYRGKSVITVKMEVAVVEGGMGDEVDHVPANSLDHVGLTGPETVPCIAVRWQMAQKLHACTETYSRGENDRFRDLIDLQLLGGLVDDDEWSDVKTACIDVFEGRAKHAWPPDLTVPPSWAEGYRQLAEATEFSILDVEEAAAAVRQLIERIDQQ